MYAAGIYNSGVLKGRDITLDSGASTNINHGVIDATSASGKGGTIELLGEKVGVFSGTVDASGKTGGGKILIGGDLHGAGNITVSDNVVIGSNALVRADATANGDGGEIVAFSNLRTDINGPLSARGANGGTGGFIETSSHGLLSVSATPTTGAGGQWLLDPVSVTIGGTANLTGDGNVTLDTFLATGDATIDPAAIKTDLEAGTSVKIDATGVAGDILWTAGNNISPAVSAAATLTMTGNANIELDSNIKNVGTAPLNIVLTTTGGGVTINANIDTLGGNVSSHASSFTFAAANTLNSAGGNVSLTNANASNINGTMNLGSGKFWSSGTDFNNTSPIISTSINILHSGNVTLSSDLNAGASGTIAIAGQFVNQAGGTITASSVAVQTTGNDGASHSITLDDTTNAFTSFASSTSANASTVGKVDIFTNTDLTVASLPGLSNIPVSGTFGATVGVTNSNATVTMKATGNISISNPINTGPADLLLLANGGNINGSGNVSGQNMNLTATGGIGGSSPLLLNPTGNVLINTGGAGAAGSASVDFAGAISTANITFTPGGRHAAMKLSLLSNANFTVNGSLGFTDVDLSITAHGSIIQSSGSLTGNVVTLSAPGSLIGTAGAPVSFAATANATFSASGNANATAGTENIFVTSAAYNKPITFATDAAAQTIGIIGGGTTIGANISAGSSNTLLIENPTSITLNAGQTLTGKNVFLTSTGDVTLAATSNITAANATNGGEVLLMGNSVTGGGAITGGKLGVNATGVARRRFHRAQQHQLPHHRRRHAGDSRRDRHPRHHRRYLRRKRGQPHRRRFPLPDSQRNHGQWQRREGHLRRQSQRDFQHHGGQWRKPYPHCERHQLGSHRRQRHAPFCRQCHPRRHRRHR